MYCAEREGTIRVIHQLLGLYRCTVQSEGLLKDQINISRVTDEGESTRNGSPAQ